MTDEPKPRYSGAPRWVKVSAIVALALVLFVAVLLLAGGNHGPGRHFGGAQSPVSAPQDALNHQRPVGEHAS